MKKVLAISSVLFGVVFLAGCGQRPVSQTQPTTPAPAVQQPTQQKNLTRLEDVGIEIEFPDGYDVFNNEAGKAEVVFGPLIENMTGTGKGRNYLLSTVAKQSAEELIAEIKNGDGVVVTVNPEIIKINDLTAVKWGTSGQCETGNIEVMGITKNYNFSSMTCSYDFDYMEKVIKTIKFL